MKIVETDVLVIGGGMAGCFAALKAREQGAEVILVDKGYVGRAGQTPFAMDLGVCNPDWGGNWEEWVAELTATGEYLNDRGWTEIVVKESLDRFKDLLSWGCEPIKRADGSLAFLRMPGVATQCIKFPEGQPCERMRKQAQKLGVKIVDRYMAVDLLTQDGKVIGAAGFGLIDGQSSTVLSKATAMCAGSYSFKPLGFPGHELSADGDVLAYRAGAEITGKEFTPVFMTRADSPGGWYPFLDGLSQIAIDHPEGFTGFVDAQGTDIPLSMPPSFREFDFAVHAGRGPLALKMDDTAAELMRDKGVDVKNNLIEVTGGPNLGMAVHGSEGIWIESDSRGSHTSVPGLFAAGDSAGSRQQGAIYCNWGFAILGASVTGARAGRGAAAYASEVARATVTKEQLEAIDGAMRVPLRRTGGFSPAWVMQLLQHMIVPYFVLCVKQADRLQAALVMVEFMRDHLVPRLLARNTHELRLAHEAHNLVINAQMKLRASLFRTESRGRHFREDFPRRDDAEWLAWTILKRDEQGRMQLSKRPVPQMWRPDTARPYEDKYPFRFPSELQPHPAGVTSFDSAR